MNRGNAGKGRRPGAINKTTRALRETLLAALDGAGGEDYLKRMAYEQPVAFMALLARLLPLEARLGTVPAQRIEVSWATADGVDLERLPRALDHSGHR